MDISEINGVTRIQHFWITNSISEYLKTCWSNQQQIIISSSQKMVSKCEIFHWPPWLSECTSKILIKIHLIYFHYIFKVNVRRCTNKKESSTVAKQQSQSTYSILSIWLILALSSSHLMFFSIETSFYGKC